MADLREILDDLDATSSRISRLEKLLYASVELKKFSDIKTRFDLFANLRSTSQNLNVYAAMMRDTSGTLKMTAQLAPRIESECQILCPEVERLISREGQGVKEIRLQTYILKNTTRLFLEATTLERNGPTGNGTFRNAYLDNCKESLIWCNNFMRKLLDSGSWEEQSENARTLYSAVLHLANTLIMQITTPPGAPSETSHDQRTVVRTRYYSDYFQSLSFQDKRLVLWLNTLLHGAPANFHDSSKKQMEYWDGIKNDSLVANASGGSGTKQSASSRSSESSGESTYSSAPSRSSGSIMAYIGADVRRTNRKKSREQNQLHIGSRNFTITQRVLHDPVNSGSLGDIEKCGELLPDAEFTWRETGEDESETEDDLETEIPPQYLHVMVDLTSESYASMSELAGCKTPSEPHWLRFEKMLDVWSPLEKFDDLSTSSPPRSPGISAFVDLLDQYMTF